MQQEELAGPTQAGLDSAVEAVLPEDAPPGHEAYTKVRFNGKHSWPLAEFKYGTGPEAQRFQTTQGACGTPEATERVARACYVRFALGDSLEQVKAFRQECYNRIREVRKGPAPEAKRPPRSRAKKSSQDLDAAVVDPASKASWADGAGAAGEPAVAPAVAGNGSADAVHKAKAEPEEPPRFITDEVPATNLHVVFDRSNGAFHFKVTDDAGEVRKFSVTMAKCGGSKPDALRAAQLCLFKLQNGMSYSELKAFRDELYARCGHKAADKAAKVDKAVKADKAGRQSTGTTAGGAADAPDEVGEQPAKRRRGRRKKGEAPEEGEVPGQQEDDRIPVIEEDAPQDSLAHKRVRFQGNGKNSCIFHFIPPDGGEGQRFQTTVRAANGCKEDAMRIARLCYAHFESGHSRAEVEELRNALYTRCGGSLSSSKTKRRDAGADGGNRKRRRTTNTSHLSDLVESLRRDGRLEGALCVEGRDASRKNASINGIYLPVKDGFNGMSAYAKADSDAAPRFLFYFASKSRWKISEQLGDEKGGFAFLKCKDQATPWDLSAEQRWQVYDGKDDGYNEDPTVRCFALHVPEGLDVSASGSAAGAGSDSDSGSSASSASSSEEASSSDSSSEEPEPAALQATRSQTPQVPQLPQAPRAQEASRPPGLPGLAAPGAPQLVQALRTSGVGNSSAVPRLRVCAKMLVRSGLRCGCHFAYVRDCPVRKAAPRAALVGS